MFFMNVATVIQTVVYTVAKPRVGYCTALVSLT